MKMLINEKRFMKEMLKKNEKIKKTYKLVAPEGGWGYMILLSYILNASSVAIFIGCFGILYNDFMLEIGMNSTKVTFLTGLNAICFGISGFFASSLLKFTSLRKLTLIAALLHNGGALGMVFVNSIPGFYMCQGVLMGLGLGLVFTLSSTILNDYFVKKKMFAFSFVQFFVAFFAMFTPMFVKWSLQEYGFKGTLLLVASIMMHNLIGVALMQPVKWHMKRVPITLPITEMQPLLVTEKPGCVPTIKLTDEEACIGTVIEKTKELPLNMGKKQRILTAIELFVDLKFAKEFILSCTCMGPALSSFADATFCLILPQALYNLNWSKDMVALSLSLLSFGDLAIRTVFIVISRWMLHVGSREIYIIGVVLAFLSRLGIILSENPIAVLFFISILGVSRGAVISLPNVIFSEVIGQEHFTQAVGIFICMSGLFILVLGPSIGMIRDFTNSYNIVFYVLTSIMGLIAIVWSIDIFIKKRNEDRKEDEMENLECTSRSSKEKE